MLVFGKFGQELYGALLGHVGEESFEFVLFIGFGRTGAASFEASRDIRESLGEEWKEVRGDAEGGSVVGAAFEPLKGLAPLEQLTAFAGAPVALREVEFAPGFNERLE